MKFIIRGRKVEVTPAIKEYIINKLGRLDKYFNNPNELTATVLIKVKDVDQIVEVTIPAKKLILRACVACPFFILFLNDREARSGIPAFLQYISY